MAPLTRLTLGMAVALLMIAGCPSTGVSSEPVFSTVQLGPTFIILGNRQCLPAGFNTSQTQPEAGACVAMVIAGGLPSECNGATALPLFYNCFASSKTWLGTTATSFNIVALENSMLVFSNDVNYQTTVPKLMDACMRASSAQLTPRQQAVYSMLCFRWSLFADCDRQHNSGTLDADGTLRRVKFLSGNCPLSPSSLLDTFGVVTGHTWMQCSQGLYTGSDVSMLYDAQVSRVSCLIQNFINTAGTVNFASLVTATKSADAGDISTVAMLKLIGDCATSNGLSQNGNTQFYTMTTAEFVQCWATEGVFGCAQQEANQSASSFPDACAISA